jgi:hypothetical protein
VKELQEFFPSTMLSNDCKFSSYNQAKLVSPLNLQASFKHEDLEVVKLTMSYADETTRKTEVPCNDMLSIEVMLYALNDFHEASRNLQTQPADLFTFYCQTLRRAARSTWDASIHDIPRTEVGFEKALTAFIHRILSDDAYENLMVYLDQTIKPRSLTPHALANHLLVLNIYSVTLPTNTGVPAELLTDDKLKAIYFA